MNMNMNDEDFAVTNVATLMELALEYSVRVIMPDEKYSEQAAYGIYAFIDDGDSLHVYRMGNTADSCHWFYLEGTIPWEPEKSDIFLVSQYIENLMQI